jgi:putative acetyltransferase
MAQPPLIDPSHRSALAIREDDPTARHVAELLEYHLRELRGVMAEFAFALDATGLSAKGVTFWTAWRNDQLCGFVALKELDPYHGELKSMRAAPATHRTGVGRALLDHVVAISRERNYRRLYLETGTADLHAAAVSLYRSAGFLPCEAFGDYRPSPHNQFLSLDLALASDGRPAP